MLVLIIIALVIESIDKVVISVGETSDGFKDMFFDTRPPSNTASTIVTVVESVASIIISFLSKEVTVLKSTIRKRCKFVSMSLMVRIDTCSTV